MFGERYWFYIIVWFQVLVVDFEEEDNFLPENDFRSEPNSRLLRPPPLFFISFRGGGVLYGG